MERIATSHTTSALLVGSESRKASSYILKRVPCKQPNKILAKVKLVVLRIHIRCTDTGFAPMAQRFRVLPIECLQQSPKNATPLYSVCTLHFDSSLKWPVLILDEKLHERLQWSGNSLIVSAIYPADLPTGWTIGKGKRYKWNNIWRNWRKITDN